jgi:hypothetical protein
MMLLSNTSFLLDRFFLSWFVTIVLVVAAFHLYIKYEKISQYDLSKVLKKSYYVFVFIAIISCSNLLNWNQSYVKAMFPFSEPSHFAIYVAPVLIFMVRINKLGYLYTIPFLVIAYLVQNSTILIVVFLAIVSKYRLKSLLVLPLIILMIFSSNLDLHYFESRFNFLEDNDNLSVLVYIQGLDIIEYTVMIKKGIGMGFQQLGFNGVTFPTTEKLRFYLDKDMNLTDGGFTLAKLIGEFGILALVIIFYYIKYFIKSFKIIFNPKADPKLVFAAILVIAYSIELIVRGLGYFNVSLLFLGMALLYIKTNYKYSS